MAVGPTSGTFSTCPGTGANTYIFSNWVVKAGGNPQSIVSVSTASSPLPATFHMDSAGCLYSTVGTVVTIDGSGITFGFNRTGGSVTCTQVCSAASLTLNANVYYPDGLQTHQNSITVNVNANVTPTGPQPVTVSNTIYDPNQNSVINTNGSNLLQDTFGMNPLTTSNVYVFNWNTPLGQESVSITNSSVSGSGQFNGQCSARDSGFNTTLPTQMAYPDGTSVQIAYQADGLIGGLTTRHGASISYTYGPLLCLGGPYAMPSSITRTDPTGL